MELSRLFDEALRLEDENKIRQAIDGYERCLVLAEQQALGDSHPGVRATKNNLAALLLSDSSVSTSTSAGRSKLERAKTLYRSALEADAQSHVALLGLARCAFEEREYDQAVELFRRTIDLIGPQSQPPSNDKLLDTGRTLDEVTDDDDRCLEEHLSFTHEGLGLTYLAQSKFAEAETCLRLALRRASDYQLQPKLFVGSMFGLAQINLQKSNFKETIRYGQMAHQFSDSVDPTLFFVLAYALEQDGQEEAAAHSFAMGKRMWSARVPVPQWLEKLLDHRFHPKNLPPVARPVHVPPSRWLIAVVVLIILIGISGIIYLLSLVSPRDLLTPI